MSLCKEDGCRIRAQSQASQQLISLALRSSIPTLRLLVLRLLFRRSSPPPHAAAAARLLEEGLAHLAPELDVLKDRSAHVAPHRNVRQLPARAAAANVSLRRRRPPDALDGRETTSRYRRRRRRDRLVGLRLCLDGRIAAFTGLGEGRGRR